MSAMSEATAKPVGISMPAIELEAIGNGQKFWWSSGKLYTNDEYLNGWEPLRMYSARDPRHGCLEAR